MTHEELLNIGNYRTAQMNGVGMGADPVTAGIAVISLVKKLGFGQGVVGSFGITLPEIEQSISIINQAKDASHQLNLKINNLYSSLNKPSMALNNSKAITEIEKAIVEYKNASNNLKKIAPGKVIVQGVSVYEKDIQSKIDLVRSLETELQLKHQQATEAHKKAIVQQHQKTTAAQAQAPASKYNFKTGSGSQVLTAGSSNKIIVGFLALLAIGSVVYGTVGIEPDEHLRNKSKTAKS